MKCAALLATVCLTTLAHAQDERAHLDPEFGFRIDVPEGWTFAVTQRTADALSMTFTPEDAPQVLTVTLTAARNPDVLEPDDVARLALQTVEAQDMYYDALLGEVELAGRSSPTLTVSGKAGGVEYRLRQTYLAEHGTRFILQSTTRKADFEDWSARFDAMWTGFAFTELDAAAEDARALERLAARCGSEVNWAEDWDDAARRAREAGTLIVCVARMYGGFSLSDATMAGPFMDPDVVRLVNARFVPLKLRKGMRVPMQDAEIYGMSATTFGAALLVVTPEGRVVRDSITEILTTLVEATSELPAPERLAGADVEASATRYLDLGALDLAAEALEALPAERGALVRARLHGMRRDAQAARAALEEGETAALRLARAYYDLRLGDFDAARAGYAQLADEGHADCAPEARFWLGVLQRASDEWDAAEATWRALATDVPDSRWAWRAAAEVESTGHAIRKSARIDWPSAGELAPLERVPYAALPPAQAQRARTDAIAWLLEQQRTDGGWATPSSVGQAPDDLPHHFELSAAALGGHALLLAGEDEAAARALAWTRDAYARVLAANEPEYLMDYTCWSRPSVLDFVSAAAAAGLAEPADLAVVASSLIGELDRMQKAQGGWSYYLSGDVEGSASPANVAMSFTSAYVVLALIRAREVGFEVPEEPLERALDALEAMRDDDGLFTYMHTPGAPASAGAAAGAAARSPVCTLALVRGGRLATEELNGALQVFVQHSAGYDAERGKTLMHTGAAGQGSHYLLFDYMTAASAIASLPREERVKYTEPLLDVLLNARTEGGAFLDNPLIGRASGTGIALLALLALER